MAAVAFAATELVERTVLGPGLAIGVFKLQLPEVWTAAGVAWDLSSYGFTNVKAVTFGAAGAATDHNIKYGVIGTYGTKGMTASTCKIVAHWSEADDAAIFNAVADSTDRKATDDLVVIVFGD